MGLKSVYLSLAFGTALIAQIPQPVPGQYPPGQLPGQVPPGGRETQVPRRSKKGDNSDGSTTTKTLSGVVRVLEAKSFDIQTEDTRILSIQITDKTVKPEELKLGDGVDVETTQDKDGLFQALNVKINT